MYDVSAAIKWSAFRSEDMLLCMLCVFVLGWVHTKGSMGVEGMRS